MNASKPVLFVAEPPPQYLFKPPAVIDCSVVASLLFAETGASQASRAVAGKSLHAPYLLGSEMTSVALKKMSVNDPEWVQEALGQFQELPITLHPVHPVGTLALARQYKLSAYDAAYLWLAVHLKSPLLTFDQRLGQAALTHLGRLE